MESARDVGGMREFFARLFELGSDGEESTEDGDGVFNEDRPDPENTSTLGADDWEWERAGEFQYDHYTEAMPDVKQLKRDQEHEAVEELLLWCIDYLEAETEMQHRREYGFAAVPPAYYRHVAIVYRKDDRYKDEVVVLKRYTDACKRIGQTPKDELQQRLERAQELAAD
jgi:hypothetical protein